MATSQLSPSLQAARQTASLAAIAVAGVAYFVAAIAALHFLRPDLNPISRPTSAYAVGPYSFLMTSAFFSMCVASLALAIGFYRRLLPSGKTRAGLAFLTMWAVGVLVAMIFPMDAEGVAPTVSGTIHQAAGPITFLSLAVAMILMSWAFRQDDRWRPLHRTALTLSLIFLAAFVATFLSFATDSGTLGIAQRIALATAVAWMLLAAARFRSTAPWNPA